jgi:hypothetical protein
LRDLKSKIVNGRIITNIAKKIALVLFVKCILLNIQI